MLEAAKIEQLSKIIGEFIGQAVCGAQMAAFRAGGLPWDDPQYNPGKIVMLYRYFNTCWASLVRNDDPYVTETFTKIHHLLPEESPLCLFHLILNLSAICLQQPLEIGFSTPKSQRVATNKAFVDVLRNMMKQMYSDEAESLVSHYYSNKPAHLCENFKFSEIAAQDPSPIWTMS
eukprot:TRINITY_DN3598_c0_g1_i5.p1 TRINITY_DN3598_c0_g1~~TRINITY_DN3598_c0_g1_i5.p1  ORF type:complete len:175 (+),score=36.78 TRINITY_DN3598_c0_g1_i5:128-652(+)